MTDSPRAVGGPVVSVLKSDSAGLPLLYSGAAFTEVYGASWRSYCKSVVRLPVIQVPNACIELVAETSSLKVARPGPV